MSIQFAATLGMSPSPGIFLSADAQHPTRPGFGPAVYVLPTYDPLRARIAEAMPHFPNILARVAA